MIHHLQQKYFRGNNQTQSKECKKMHAACKSEFMITWLNTYKFKTIYSIHWHCHCLFKGLIYKPQNVKGLVTKGSSSQENWKIGSLQNVIIAILVFALFISQVKWFEGGHHTMLPLHDQSGFLPLKPTWLVCMYVFSYSTLVHVF